MQSTNLFAAPSLVAEALVDELSLARRQQLQQTASAQRALDGHARDRAAALLVDVLATNHDINLRLNQTRSMT